MYVNESENELFHRLNLPTLHRMTHHSIVIYRVGIRPIFLLQWCHLRS